MKYRKGDPVFPLPVLQAGPAQPLVAGIGRPAPVTNYQRSERTSAIYAAEAEVRRIMRNPAELAPNGHLGLYPVELRWDNIEAVRGYLGIVLSWPWGKWRHGTAWPCTAQWSDGGTVNYRSGVIYFPREAPWMLRELVVLHEVAHHFTPRHNHDQAWVQAFLDLVGSCMNPVVAQLLRTHLNQNGIAT